MLISPQVHPPRPFFGFSFPEPEQNLSAGVRSSSGSKKWSIICIIVLFWLTDLLAKQEQWHKQKSTDEAEGKRDRDKEETRDPHAAAVFASRRQSFILDTKQDSLQ